MIYIGVIAAVFGVMLCAPFAGALFYCEAREGRVLPINQQKVRDARYFGKAFARLIEENLSLACDGRIFLSKSEPYVNGDLCVPNQEQIRELVICTRRDYETPDLVRVYEKEIYAAHDLYIRWKRIRMRAAYAAGSAYLGAGTMVDRWVDAKRELIAAKDCNLGMSASAGERLWIGNGCMFKRLYAPEIFVGGQRKETVLAHNVDFPAQMKLMQELKKDSIRNLRQDSLQNTIGNLARDSSRIGVKKEAISGLMSGKIQRIVGNIRYIDAQYTDEHGVAPITVVTSRNLIVPENIIVQGDIRSHKGVRLCDHAVVCGNIFAEEDIRIGVGAMVLGNVFTQGNIVVERGGTIGQPGHIRSMVARGNITLDDGVMIYGFVSCEGGGHVNEKEKKESV